MAILSENELNKISRVVAPIIEHIAPEQRQLFLAMAERMAGARYRFWAKGVDDPALSVKLIECAEREEEIARKIEALHPDAAAIQKNIHRAHPELDNLEELVFGDLPLFKQFAIQAQGERAGAARWEAFAGAEKDPRKRRVLRECAQLELDSAIVLEKVLEAQVGTGDDGKIG